MRNKAILFLFAFLFLFLACEDIFEADLENEIVQIIAPKDGLQTEISTHTFWWEYVEGADFYNLQIVSPSFDNILHLSLDTNIIKNQFLYTLTPGDYEWRVNGYNTSSSTAYTTYSLTVIDTTSLAFKNKTFTQ